MSRTQRKLAPFLIVLALACSESATPAAHVRGVAGTAQVRPKGGELSPATSGRALFVGDSARTGEDGAMTLEFAGGNVVELQPGTVVEIREDGAAASTIGAIVLEGEAKVRSSGGGMVLRIGLPFENRTLEIGTGPVEILVGEKGVQVLVGSIEVIGEDGQPTAVEAGEVFQIGGVVIDLADRTEDETDDVMEVEEVVITLLSNPRFVRLKRAGEDTWSRPKKTDSLAVGDAVRTQRRGTIMAFDDASRVRLDGDTELTLDEAKRTGAESRAAYTLSKGGASIRLKRGEVDTKHTVAVGETAVEIRPGAQEASVDIEQSPDGRGRVAVQFGQAKLSDGTVVGPGQAVDLEAGKVTGAPTELAPTDVQLRPGMSTVVYYSSQKPAVVFSWKPEEGATAYELELSRNKGFDGAPVFREELDRDRFVYEQLDEGAYYWRVKASGAGEADWKRGLFRVKRGSPSRCGKNCGRENLVRDTGVKTVVYFQQALPSITLVWDEVQGASSYRLKVFRDGEFERPFVDQTLQLTKRKFQAGQFEEGKYFWLVNALDPGGGEVRTGGTNGLEIKFDNSAVDIQIASPASNQRVRKSKILTSGEVPLGQSLFINGQRVKLGDDGRFREYVTLDRKGRHSIVYRTLASDGVERYYVRDVFRR